MAGDPTPTLEVVGGWTSARLLIRLLYTIESPWNLGPDGLTHRDTGETCALEMRGADPAFVRRLVQGESPVVPSLTDGDLAALEDHRSVVRVRAVDAPDGPSACRAVLRCGQALIDGGGAAVHCVESGLSHGGEHWRALAGLAHAAGEEGDADQLAEAVFLAFVHPLRRWPHGHRTAGMGLLGRADAAVPAQVPDAVALDVMEALHRRVLTGRVPAAGDRVRAGPSRPAFRLERGPDPTDPGSGGHNPFGLWRLVPQTG